MEQLVYIYILAGYPASLGREGGGGRERWRGGGSEGKEGGRDGKGGEGGREGD